MPEIYVCTCTSMHFTALGKMKATYLSFSTGYYFTDPNETTI